jgi:hypothetical protein
MVLGFVELRMANNRRNRAGANIAISKQLISNALVKDHAAALGVRNSNPVRMPEVLISAMWHLRVGADVARRWLRHAVITVRKRAYPVDERRKPAS